MLNIGKQIVRVLICFMLLAGSPESVVLCVEADGQTHLKTAFHQKEHAACHHCHHNKSHHRHKDIKRPDQYSHPTGNNIQTNHELQSCVDVPFLVGSLLDIESTSDQLSQLIFLAAVISHGDIETEITIDIQPNHPPDETNPSLPALRAVILLT